MSEKKSEEDLEEELNNEYRSTGYGTLYVPRMFAQHPFPLSDQRKNVYRAFNGNKVLLLEAGYEFDPVNDEIKSLGLPFGMLPRWLILMITTKAKLTGNREVNLSKTISKFLKKIGYEVSGGDSGSLTQLNNQIKRLINCRISYLIFEDTEKPETNKMKVNVGPIDEITFWDVSYDEEDEKVKNVQVRLHERFFYEIKNHSFPVKELHIQKLRPKVFAIDLYLYLSHRMSYLKKDTLISWEDLNKQFGSNFSNHVDFGKRAREYIRLIQKEVYPELNYVFKRGRLVLKKSPTPVKKLSTINY
ncbi:replication protein RepA [Fodinibius halophilus]|uniref:Plasmid encoded RepA protein n=1 Tax=Fodinibius halophilus TaxID=1736908 RepID=A0A6M1TB66_9BACT|nr:replication protein RepA [Fodinibius halophilus]NGP87572.1 hypothetical protein [Fodinibius halophilus]